MQLQIYIRGTGPRLPSGSVTREIVEPGLRVLVLKTLTKTKGEIKMKKSAVILGMAFAVGITFSMAGTSFAHGPFSSSQVGYSYKWVVIPKCFKGWVTSMVKTPKGYIGTPKSKCTRQRTKDQVKRDYKMIFSTLTVSTGNSFRDQQLPQIIRKKSHAYPANKCTWTPLGKKKDSINFSLSSPTGLSFGSNTVYEVKCRGN